MIDGFDVQIITYVAPVLTKAFQVERSMLGPVFSAGLVGTVVGALVLAPIADRIGRRLGLAVCVLLFGICSFGTMTASNIESLMAWRLVGGLGLGGATPIAVALGAEYSPKRIRATAVMLIYCGFALGAAGGGLLTAHLLQAFGWQTVFLIGGLLPTILLVVIIAILPESISYLAMRGKRVDLIVNYAEKIDPAIRLDRNGALIVEDRSKGFPVTQLFAEGRTAQTLVLWLMFITNILSLYFMVSWFPTLAHAAGVELSSAVVASSLIHVGSVTGTLSLAILVRKLDTFLVMCLGFAGGAIALVLVSQAGNSVTYLMVVAFVAGFFVIGTQTGANGISSLVYPTSIRSTGVGWALGIGRIGAILGPLIGGVLIGFNWSSQALYIAAAVPAAVAAASAYALSRLLLRSSGHASIAQ
jgi:AAHS family 4-hydroxybenzoate transporter-like MFS transporter